MSSSSSKECSGRECQRIQLQRTLYLWYVCLYIPYESEINLLFFDTSLGEKFPISLVGKRLHDALPLGMM